ncbi:L-ascorbate oxidase [Scenedesmus sp. PABB004]|nr:L-ascorbate oxidase [Scenedesmus sp. PABB004]
MVKHVGHTPWWPQRDSPAAASLPARVLLSPLWLYQKLIYDGRPDTAGLKTRPPLWRVLQSQWRWLQAATCYVGPPAHILVNIRWPLLVNMMLAIGIVADLARPTPLLPHFGTFVITTWRLISFVMALLLAFRLNRSYDRWWLARQSFGGVAGASMALSQQAIAYVQDAAIRAELLRWAKVWPWCILQACRGDASLHARAAAVLTADELRFYDAVPKPREVIHFNLRSLVALAGRALGDAEHQALEGTVATGIAAAGGCVRIRMQAMPLAASLMCTGFLQIFLMFLPCGLLMELPTTAATPAWGLVIYFFTCVLLLGVDEVANQLEMPFTAIPMEDMANSTARDLDILLGQAAALGALREAALERHRCSAGAAPPASPVPPATTASVAGADAAVAGPQQLPAAGAQQQRRMAVLAAPRRSSPNGATPPRPRDSPAAASLRARVLLSPLWLYQKLIYDGRPDTAGLKTRPAQWRVLQSKWRWLQAATCYVGPPAHILVNIRWPLLVNMMLAIGIVADLARPTPLLPHFGTFVITTWRLISFVMALLLAFRLNRSYDRWWLARQSFGGVAGASMALSQQAIAYVQDAAIRAELLRWAKVWPWCILQACRGDASLHARAAAVLTADELRFYDAVPKPREVIHFNLRSLVALAGRALGDAEHQALEGTVATGIAAAGGCMRIRMQAMPLAASLMCSGFLQIFLMVLPCGLMEPPTAETPAWGLVIYFFTCVLLLGVDEVANQLEMPFTAIPMEDMANSTARDLDIRCELRIPAACGLLLLMIAAAAAAVCPNIERADKHFTLTASDYKLKLPNNATVAQKAYNDSVVGPPLIFDLGDDVSIDVTNNLDSAPTSVHWHGLLQRNTSWADGVDTVSHSAFEPGETFRYRFTAEPAGTFWYHAHTGEQFADGLRGPLIIRVRAAAPPRCRTRPAPRPGRPPRRRRANGPRAGLPRRQDPADPYKGQYDDEVVLMLYDQSNQTADDLQRQLVSGEARMRMGLCDGEAPARDYSDIPYFSIFTNGQGWVRDEDTGAALGAPHVITVKKGRRYRFRTIQGSASWGLKFAPLNHSMTIIAVDGANVAPTPARGFIVNPGERVDFLLTANQPVGNYWINVAALPGFNSPAVLHYEGAPPPASDPKLGKPTLDLGCRYQLETEGVVDFKDTTLPPHKGTPPPPPKPTVAHVVYLTDNAVPSMGQADVLGPNGTILGLAPGVSPSEGCPGNGSYCWSLNWIPYEFTERPLISTPLNATLGNRTYVQDVAQGDVVDIAFINPTAMLHPMHIHGYTFYVLGTGVGDILTPDGRIDYAQLEVGKPGCCMLRDTVPVGPAAPTGPKPDDAPKGGGMAAMRGGARRLRQAGAMAGMLAPPAANATRAAAMAATGADMPAPPAANATRAAAMAAAGAGMPAPAANATRAAAAAAGAMPAGDAMPDAMGADAMPTPRGGANATMPVEVPMEVAMDAMSTPLSGKEFGYTVVRFVADNPGVWAFHCHIDAHAGSGMFFVLRVAPRGAYRNSSGQPWAVPRDLEGCSGGAADREAEPAAREAPATTATSAARAATARGAAWLSAAALALAALAAL